MKFSIVTPTYNVGNKFELLINSLNNQKYKDFELIIIDDNSSEENKVIMKNDIKKANFDYKYIVNNDNIGAGKSRNVGLFNASGDYILFIDADDYVSNDLLLSLNNVIENNNFPDIVMFDLLYINKNKNKKIKTLIGFADGFVDTNNVLLYSTNCVAGKCIKSNIIKKNKIIFPDLKRYEDWVFNCNCFAHSSKIYYINKSLYFYVNNSTSVVNSHKSIDLQCANDAFNIIKSIDIKEDILNFLYLREVEYLYLKKIIFCKPINLDVNIIDFDFNTSRYITKKHLKFSKYLLLKSLNYNFVKNRLRKEGD